MYKMIRAKVVDIQYFPTRATIIINAVKSDPPAIKVRKQLPIVYQNYAMLCMINLRITIVLTGFTIFR